MTYDEPLFVRTVSEFTAKLLTSYDVGDVLGDLTSRVTDLFRLTGCGVTLARDGEIEYVTAVPSQVSELERAQFVRQTGPGVAAYNRGETVAVADLRDTAVPWRGYREAAHRLGVVAVASIPMQLGGETFGALHMYAGAPRRWTQRDLAAARVMADMATSYLINASTYDKQKQLAEQLQGALTSRVVIEQAKGVLASAHGVSVDDAFEQIRRYARSHHRNIHEVSEDVVRHDLRP